MNNSRIVAQAKKTNGSGSNPNGSISTIRSRKNQSKRIANISNAYNCSAPNGPGVKRETSNSNSRSGSVPS